jgi:prepilin-type N-terminal cleavage/methylation domain-containing protein
MICVIPRFAPAARNFSRRNRGFTLVEMMVAITVILILLGMGLPIYSHTIARKKEDDLRTNLETLNKLI